MASVSKEFAYIKKPLERGFNKAQEKLLLGASWVFFVFFLGAVNFFVIGLATAMATCEGGHRQEHKSGNESSDYEFHRNTFRL
jgi:hypothetical protein